MSFKKIAVAGGGVLGSQIAFQSAYCGLDVTIWLRMESSIGRSRPKIERLRQIYLDTLEALKTDPAAYAYGLIAREDVSPEALDACKERAERAYASLRLTTDWEEAFSDADLVIEAVAETPDAKTAFYKELRRHIPERTVIVTNSSTLLPSSFAETTGRPDKFLALHFANEIWRNPTGEVMGHADTDPTHFEEIVEFASQIRMVPIRVLKEQPGYILNSLLVPLISAALRLWATGVGTPEDIDKDWTISTGAPYGPFRLLDIIGLVTPLNIISRSPQAKDESSIEHKIVQMLQAKMDRGETGVNAGKGFYDYGGGGPAAK